jgi:hypothetical protein
LKPKGFFVSPPDEIGSELQNLAQSAGAGLEGLRP